MARSVDRPVVDSDPWVRIFCTAIRREPRPNCPPPPTRFSPTISAKEARPALKPMVPALAMLSPTTPSSRLVVERPFWPM